MQVMTQPDFLVAESDWAADFDGVVRQYWPKVFRFALVSLRDRNAAETVAQDCFTKAWQARQSFRGDSSLGTWLMQIAVNLIRDHARSRKLQFWRMLGSSTDEARSAAELLADNRTSPEMDLAAKEQLAAVWNATASLPEMQRAVFLLRFVEDMDLLEIAQATGLREGTVKTHLFRALQTVRKKVSRGGNPEKGNLERTGARK